MTSATKAYEPTEIVKEFAEDAQKGRCRWYNHY